MAAPPVNQSQKRITAPTQQPTVLPAFPEHPPDVRKRFPSLIQYDNEVKQWLRDSNYQVGGT